MKKNHQVCTRCVMDTTAPTITFDKQGICSFCTEYISYSSIIFRPEDERLKNLDSLLQNIKQSKAGKYDCIIGLSGGADSTYVAYLAKKHGLNPIAIHLDNGWNTELAVKNIASTINSLGIELYTHVIDWQEFREIQLTFFKAGVIDLEMPTDHAIGAIIYRLAKKFNIKYFLSGTNLATEAMMPEGWFFDNKLDPINIKGIYKKFDGKRNFETFPLLTIPEYIRRKYFSPINVVSFLNYFVYNKPEAVALLQREIGYVPYPIKHYESVFTRFYQGHILPFKFDVDKRKPFLSTMIMTGQISRKEAHESLMEPPYEESLLIQDKQFVMKKLGFSEVEFETYMSSKEVSHYCYPSLTKYETKLRRLLRPLKRLKKYI